TAFSRRARPPFFPLLPFPLAMPIARLPIDLPVALAGSGSCGNGRRSRRRRERLDRRSLHGLSCALRRSTRRAHQNRTPYE
ncbi:MAG: hypothetical protein ACRDWD_15235, partial [Acidimicrobiia bacterium]